MFKFNNVGGAVVLVMRSRKMNYTSMAKKIGYCTGALRNSVKANAIDGRVGAPLIKAIEFLELDIEELVRVGKLAEDMKEILGPDALDNFSRVNAYGIAPKERPVTKITPAVTGKAKVKSVR